MAKFKVGDICIFHSIPAESGHAKYNGEECTILEVSCHGDVDLYKIDFNKDITDLSLKYCNEKYLKLKLDRGDMDTVVSWDECGWNPHKQPVEA